jgi:hypothetical protein
LTPTINTWANIIKNNVDVETAEKNQVEKAAKMEQNAESKLAINTWTPIIKIKIPTSSQGVIDRDWTEELAVESNTLETTPPTALKNIKEKTDEVVARA